MIKDSPIPYRNGDYSVVCAKCGHEQLELQTPTSFEYYAMNEYLDGFREGMENEYFNLLFQKCENCDNFAPTLQLDWTKTFVNEKIQKILNSDAPEMEKRLLIAYEIEPSHQALLNLYWYYDIKRPSKVEEYRDRLIKQFEDAYDDEQSIYSLRMYVELLRRRGDFRKAIRFAKKARFLPNNEINRSLKMSSPNEEAIIKQEIELCKAKDDDRHLFEQK